MSTRRLKLAWFACLPLVLLAIGGDRANAQPLVAARILSVDGPVEIRRAPASGATLKKITFRLHDELKAGDRIVTGWRGRLVLGLTDGSQAVVGAQTVVEIKDLGSSPRELFHVLRGKTRVYIEKLGGRPNPYRINTPTAVIAVRGTLFDVIVKINETEVFVHEGEVAVSRLNAPAQMVILSAGEMTRVRQGRAPTPPTPFKPGRNDDSFRRVADPRPVADISDLRDSTTVEETLRNTRAVTPTVRQGSNTSPQPTSGQRGAGRRP